MVGFALGKFSQNVVQHLVDVQVHDPAHERDPAGLHRGRRSDQSFAVVDVLHDRGTLDGH